LSFFEGDRIMKTLLIAFAAFGTLIVTSATEADARPGYRGGVYGGGGYRGVAVARGYRGGYRGVAVARGYRGGYGRYGYGYRRYGYGYRPYRYGLAAAGVGAAAYYGANAGYYRGCGPYAYFDPYYRVCRAY
jgi:hypothetical protein